MPNAPWIPGSWNWKMLDQAYGDDVDIFGREYDRAVATARLFGPRLIPHDTKAQFTYRMFDITGRYNSLREQARKVVSDYVRKRISKNAFDNKMKDIKMKTSRLEDEINKLKGNI